MSAVTPGPEYFLPAAPGIPYFRPAMPNGKINTYLTLSFVFALWFALTSGVWAYLANLVISFPFGIASFLFYRTGVKRGGNTRFQQLIKITWAIGMALSLIMLLFIK